jgi:hypothetical protein
MEARLTIRKWTRRGRLLACLTLVSTAGAAALFSTPGSAAAPGTCQGHVDVAKTSKEVTSNALGYVLICDTNVVGFSVFSTTKELSEYSPTASVLKGDGSDATSSGNKEFECGGDLPGYAHNCKGLLKATYIAHGELGATNAPCAGEPTQWWAVVVDDAGQVHGPFSLGKRTRGCPKASHAKKAAPKKATKKAALKGHKQA